jgi:hypothetical protein
VPVRDRNPGVGGGGDRRGDAGNDLEGDPGLTQLERFLATAPEDKGVAALEPHDLFARARPVDQERVDVLLRHRRVRVGKLALAVFADEDQLGVQATLLEQDGVGEAVVGDHIRTP